MLGDGGLLGSCGIPHGSLSSPEWDGGWLLVRRNLGRERDAVAGSPGVGRGSEGSSGCKGSLISLDKSDQVVCLPHLDGGQATIPPPLLGPEPTWGNQPMAKTHPDCPWDGLVV